MRRCNTMLENIDKPTDLSRQRKEALDSRSKISESVLSFLPAPDVWPYPYY
jgi:nitrogen fixation/metabolism regulation signal transduction histidine kinase